MHPKIGDICMALSSQARVRLLIWHNRIRHYTAWFLWIWLMVSLGLDVWADCFSSRSVASLFLVMAIEKYIGLQTAITPGPLLQISEQIERRARR